MVVKAPKNAFVSAQRRKKKEELELKPQAASIGPSPPRAPLLPVRLFQAERNLQGDGWQCQIKSSRLNAAKGELASRGKMRECNYFLCQAEGKLHVGGGQGVVKPNHNYKIKIIPLHFYPITLFLYYTIIQLLYY